jgi:L-rhamnose-H+ transport protein
MIAANPVLGIFMHAVGAFCASVCYTPQGKTKGWSWQTYWLVQAFFCWFFLPIVGAILTIPNLMEVLSVAPRDAMLKSFLLGAAFGIGGAAFGIAIRYLGFSLTYAFAIGLSCVLGTIIPPLVKGQIGELFSKSGAGWIIAGVVVGVLGIALCGLAGRLKEQDLADASTRGTFSLTKGVPLCFVAGVLSAVYGFALEAGSPIAEVAAKYGAGDMQSNVVYIFSNTGAFLTTVIYCALLHGREKTWAQYIALPSRIETTDEAAEVTEVLEKTQRRSLPFFYAMAALTGLLWYCQFFFYGLGHVRMGTFKFTSWGIHMIMLVLFSSMIGVVAGEWRKTRSGTKSSLSLALSVLVLAVLALSYGNYLGGS